LIETTEEGAESLVSVPILTVVHFMWDSFSLWCYCTMCLGE